MSAPAQPRTESRLAGCWHRFWFEPAPYTRLGIWRALVCGLALHDVLLLSPMLLHDARRFDEGGGLRAWNPIYLFDLFGMEPLSLAGAQTLLAVGVVALVCGALGLCSRLSCTVGAVAFYLQAGLVYSFGKPHHDKVALAFAIAVLPLAPVGARISLDAIWRAWRGRPRLPDAGEWARWPLRVAQLAVATGYCLAGLSKLWMAGPDWFNGYSLQGILIGHDNELARLVAGSRLACIVQSVGLVATQALFPLVFLVPWLRWVFLPLAISFHLVTWMTMDTGPYMRLWLLVAVFLPLERVPATLRGWFRNGGARTLGATVLMVVPTALVVYVVSRSTPWWGVVLGFGPLLVAAAVYLTDAGLATLRFDPGDPAQRRATALLRGFDWARRLRFEPQPAADGDAGSTALPELQPVGTALALHGRDAVRSAARRTLCAPLARWLPVRTP